MRLVDKVVTTEINHQIENYLPSIEEKLAHLDKSELIKHFVSAEFNRFLSFYKNAPDLNVLGSNNKYRNDRGERREKRGERKKRRGERNGHAEAGHTRFFINLGKEKDMQAHNLIGLINEYTRNRNITVGKIDIMGKFSFFEVSNDFETDILSSFSDAVWNGNRVNVEVSQAPGTKSLRGGGNRGGGSRDGGRSYSGRGDRKRSSNNRRRDRKGGRSSGSSSYSKREGAGRTSSSGGSSSFRGKFNAAAKRKRIN
jgi:ATP-dependent RNA helicase DeaD